MFAQRNGVVVTASDVLSFRVGGDFTSIQCTNVDRCTQGMRANFAPYRV